jgi:hypothetical protein
MSSTQTNKQFADLLKEAKTNPDIIGFFLGGSRGKGFQNSHSDYDIRMIVKNKVAKTYQKKYEKMKFEEIDLVLIGLSEFRKYALWNSPESWDRYDFTHVKALVAKTGEIQKLIDGKGSIPKDKKRDFIVYNLDAYINAVFRSVKCFRNRNETGARLEASTSIPYLLDLVFGLHSRPKPFYGYLDRELKAYPLKKLPWSGKRFSKMIQNILVTADLKTQQKILKTIEKLFRSEGFGNVFDGWEGKDKWTMNYQLKL